tara:strand:- start:1855 stop:2421 length:567 start_codon:yes stop_codon:yes gene_type:complete
MTKTKNMAYWRAKNGMKSAGSFDGGLIGGERSPMRQVVKDVLNPDMPEDMKRKVSGLKHKEMEEAEGNYPKHTHGPKGEMIEDDAPTKQKTHKDYSITTELLNKPISPKQNAEEAVNQLLRNPSIKNWMKDVKKKGTYNEKEAIKNIINQIKNQKPTQENWKPAFPGADHSKEDMKNMTKDELEKYYN